MQIMAVLDAARGARGIAYLVAKDTQGRVIAAVGTPAGEALPGLDPSLESSLSDERFDTIVPLALGARPVGTAYVGISTAPWRVAIDGNSARPCSRRRAPSSCRSWSSSW